MSPLSKLSALLSSVPVVECDGRCAQVACRDLTLSVLEDDLLDARHRVRLSSRADGSCGALVEGRCGVYPDRPLICRLWGVMREVRCPFGCRPVRWVSPEEAAVWLAELERFDVRATRWIRVGARPDGDVSRALGASYALAAGADQLSVFSALSRHGPDAGVVEER